MMTRRYFTIAAVLILLAGSVAVFVLDKAEQRGVTRRIEQAGGFVGSEQPPDWMHPVYDLVCRIHFFCDPYQLILDKAEVTDETLSLAKKLKHLRILELSDATVTQSQVGLLMGMKQLQTLEFRRTKFPEGALLQLRIMLPEVKIVATGEGQQAAARDGVPAAREP